MSATEEPQSPQKTESLSENQATDETSKSTSSEPAATDKLTTPAKSTVESSDASESKSRSESTPSTKTPDVKNGTESTKKARGSSVSTPGDSKSNSAKKQGKQSDSKKDAEEVSTEAEDKTNSGEKGPTSDGEIAPAASLDTSSSEVKEDSTTKTTTVASEEAVAQPVTGDGAGDVQSSKVEEAGESGDVVASADDDSKQTELTTGATEVQDENRKPGDGEKRDRANHRGGYRNRGDYQKRGGGGGGRRGFPAGGGLKSPPYRANFEISKGPDDEPVEGEVNIDDDTRESSNLNVTGQEDAEGAAAGGQDETVEGDKRPKGQGRRGRNNRYNDRPGYYAPRQYPSRSSRPTDRDDEVQGDDERGEKSAIPTDSTKETSEVSAGEEKGDGAGKKKNRRRQRKRRSRSKSVGSVEGEAVKVVDEANGYASADDTSNQRDNSPGRRRQYYNRGGGGGGGGGGRGGGYRGGRGGYWRGNYNQVGSNNSYYRPRTNYNQEQGVPGGTVTGGQERLPGQYYNSNRGGGGYQPRPYNQPRSYYNYNRGGGGYRGGDNPTGGGPPQHGGYDRPNQSGGNYRGSNYRRPEGGRPGYSQNRRYQGGVGNIDVQHEREVPSGDT